MVELRKIPLGEYQTNCYLLVDSLTHQGVLIDPSGEEEKLLAWIGSLEIIKILLTHGHEDHVGALAAAQAKFEAPVGIHPADGELFDIQADIALQAGDHLQFETYRLEVAHIPGHTPGSIALRIFEGELSSRALVGDAIFPGGPGHTETPKDLAISLDSLAGTVFTWDDDTVLYPGHGEPTTVGAERRAFKAFRAKTLPRDLCGDVSWR